MAQLDKLVLTLAPEIPALVVKNVPGSDNLTVWGKNASGQTVFKITKVKVDATSLETTIPFASLPLDPSFTLGESTEFSVMAFGPDATSESETVTSSEVSSIMVPVCAEDIAKLNAGAAKPAVVPSTEPATDPVASTAAAAGTVKTEPPLLLPATTGPEAATPGPENVVILPPATARCNPVKGAKYRFTVRSTQGVTTDESMYAFFSYLLRLSKGEFKEGVKYLLAVACDVGKGFGSETVVEFHVEGNKLVVGPATAPTSGAPFIKLPPKQPVPLSAIPALRPTTATPPAGPVPALPSKPAAPPTSTTPANEGRIVALEKVCSELTKAQKSQGETLATLQTDLKGKATAADVITQVEKMEARLAEAQKTQVELLGTNLGTTLGRKIDEALRAGKPTTDPTKVIDVDSTKPTPAKPAKVSWRGWNWGLIGKRVAIVFIVAVAAYLLKDKIASFLHPNAAVASNPAIPPVLLPPAPTNQPMPTASGPALAGGIPAGMVTQEQLQHQLDAMRLQEQANHATAMQAMALDIKSSLSPQFEASAGNSHIKTVGGQPPVFVSGNNNNVALAGNITVTSPCNAPTEGSYAYAEPPMDGPPQPSYSYWQQSYSPGFAVTQPVSYYGGGGWSGGNWTGTYIGNGYGFYNRSGFRGNVNLCIGGSGNNRGSFHGGGGRGGHR